MKHSFEKVGDHWEKKAGGRKGPPTPRPRAAGTRPADGGWRGRQRDARLTCSRWRSKLGVTGRSTMKKKQLVDAIQKANNKKTADARKK